MPDIETHLSIELTVDGVDGSPVDRDALEACCDAIMEELVALETAGCGVSDAAVALDLDGSEVTIELAARGETFEAAEETALAAIRSAIHKAGGHTPNWRTHDKRTQLVH